MLTNKFLELSDSKASLRYCFLLSFFWGWGGGSGHSTLVGFTLAIRANVQENLEDNFEIKKTLGITLVGFTLVRLTRVQENRGGRPDAARLAADV